MTRSRVVAALVGLAIGVVTAVTAVQGEASEPAATSTIAAAAQGTPTVSERSLADRGPGYYQVYRGTGKAFPAYWLAPGTATSAPSGIRSMEAFEAGAATGVNDRAGQVIYGPTASVVPLASFNDCPVSWVCLWENAGFGGRMLQFKTQGPWQNLNQYNFNDQASAVRNNTDHNSGKFAEDSNGNGQRLCYHPNTYSSNLNFGWNDRISSVQVNNGDAC